MVGSHDDHSYQLGHRFMQEITRSDISGVLIGFWKVGSFLDLRVLDKLHIVAIFRYDGSERNRIKQGTEEAQIRDSRHI